jgi:hypothetical protein
MRHAWGNEKCMVSWSGNAEEEYLGVRGAVILECIREVDHDCILWIPDTQGTVKWWAFVNTVINSEFLIR